jgi:hypothetical protein
MHGMHVVTAGTSLMAADRSVPCTACTIAGHPIEPWGPRSGRMMHPVHIALGMAT